MRFKYKRKIVLLRGWYWKARRAYLTRKYALKMLFKCLFYYPRQPKQPTFYGWRFHQGYLPLFGGYELDFCKYYKIAFKKGGGSYYRWKHYFYLRDRTFFKIYGRSLF